MPIPKNGAIAGFAAPNSSSPKKPAARAKIPWDAMNPFGEELRMPAAISFFATASDDAFGLTLNINFATWAVTGTITRSRNFGSSFPVIFSRP